MIYRGSGYYNLLDSGAVKGDGVSDDAPIIQELLNALAGGVMLVVPPAPGGSYRLGSTVTVPAGSACHVLPGATFTGPGSLTAANGALLVEESASALNVVGSPIQQGGNPLTTTAASGNPSPVGNAAATGSNPLAAPLDHVHTAGSGLDLTNPVVSGAPSTVAGQLGVDASHNLTVGDGTTSRVLVDESTTQAITGQKTLTNPVVSGAPGTTAGVLGIDAGKHLNIGDGTATHVLVDEDSPQTLSGKTYQAPMYPVAATVTASTYTVQPSDTVLRMNAGSNNITLTLPAATGSGRVLSVFRTDNNPATGLSIRPTGADTINGLTSILIAAQYALCTFVDAASGVWLLWQALEISNAVLTNPTLAQPTVNGPLNANSLVGASNKRPLNFVPVNGLVTGSGTGTITLNLSSYVPASAVAVAVSVSGVISASGGVNPAGIEFGPALPSEVDINLATPNSPSNVYLNGGGVVRITTPQQIQAAGSTDGTLSSCQVTVRINGYWEPS